MKYFFKDIKNGFKIGIVEEKDDKFEIVTWIVKPKTYSTEHFIADEFELSEGTKEISQILFNSIYVKIPKERKFTMRKYEMETINKKNI